MNGASTSNTGAGAGSTLSPVKNAKSISITKLDGGFLIEKQNVDTYGRVNDVAIDLDGAMKAASAYLAD